jgi:hypothetical protein
MFTFQLSYDDFRRVARVCQSIRVRQLPRGFDFKGFLVQLLRRNAPGAALQMEQMSVEEMEELRGEIAELQDLVA